MLLPYFASLIEITCLLYIMKKYAKTELKIKRADIIIIVLCVVIIGSMQNASALPFLLGQLIIFTYGTIVYSKHTFHGFLLVSYTSATIIVLQFICVGILALIPIDFDVRFMSIIGNSVTLLLSVLVLKIPAIQKLYSSMSTAYLPYKLVFINSFTVLNMLLLYFKLNPQDLYMKIVLIMAIIMFLLTFNAWLLFYDNKLRNQVRELEKYQKELSVYRSILDDIRASQHEFNNRINTIRCLPHIYQTYDDLSAAIIDSTEKNLKRNHICPVLKINMPMLAASLYSMYLLAEQNQISICYDICNLEIKSKASELELCDYTSILLQNAIEECTQGDIIYVRMENIGDRLHFEVRSPQKTYISDEEIVRFFEKGYTTKKTKDSSSVPHGTGLYHLSRQVKLRKGSILVTCYRDSSGIQIIFILEI